MPAARRQRRTKGQQEKPQWQAAPYPLLREQRALQAATDPAELAAAQARAQVLVEHGYGALEDWLLADPSPAELRAMQRLQKAPSGHGLDLFDQAG